MVVEKRKSGISLISLIITIIVIIILAAIVIFSGMDTPEKAQLSKVISDIDNVQTAVDQAYYGLYTEKAVAGEVWTPSQFYEAVATGEKNRDNLTGIGLIEIGENSLVDINLPKYEGRKWYIAVSDVSDTIKTGSAVLSPGFESQGKTYATLLDIQNGGSDGSEANGGNQGDEQDENSIIAKLEVGDYVKYEADSNNSYQISLDMTGNSSFGVGGYGVESPIWRVWEKKDGTVTIMPTSPVNYFKLGESTGYVNAIDIINGMCKMYVNEKYGVSAEDIRSLTIEDLEAISENLTTKRDNYRYMNGEIQYGETNLEYYGIKKGNSEYKGYIRGTIYVEDDGKTINRNGRVASSTNPIILKSTYYRAYDLAWKTLPSNKFSYDTYGNLLGGGESWLASCMISIWEDYPAGECPIASADDVFTIGWSNSYDVEFWDGAGVRPLVSLSSSKLKVSGGNGTEASPWTLEKK